MHLIDSIQLDYAPREILAKKVPPISQYVEMSSHQSAFLCGLLNLKKPSKILEVGVAAGGTSAIVLQCMENLDIKYEMHSVDCSKNYYRDVKQRTGFLVDAAKLSLGSDRQHLYLGGVLPEYISEIGDGIDFLILDTVHTLPGEILDFLVILPYLSDDALVCLHDIALNQLGFPDIYKESNATNVLFHSVRGKKILNFLSDDLAGTSFPNIGAFQITPDTKKDILDVFLSLTMGWTYLPSMNDLEIYGKYIKLHYEDDLCKLFDMAVLMNQNNRLFFKLAETIPKSSSIILYGAGKNGVILFDYLKSYCHILRWVDKNYEDLHQSVHPMISNPETTDYSEGDYVVVSVKNEKKQREVKEFLKRKGIQEEKIIVGL